jgi:hypothetical protein
MQPLLTNGLQATATLWPPLQNASRFVHQMKGIIANPEQHIRRRYLALLAQMCDEIVTLVPRDSAREHVCPMTDNGAPGLFPRSDREGLPRTTYELEQCFGVALVQSDKPRADVRPLLAFVVRGSVRALAAVVTKQQVFSVEDLRPKDSQQ